MFWLIIRINELRRSSGAGRLRLVPCQMFILLKVNLAWFSLFILLPKFHILNDWGFLFFVKIGMRMLFLLATACYMKSWSERSNDQHGHESRLPSIPSNSPARPVFSNTPCFSSPPSFIYQIRGSDDGLISTLLCSAWLQCCIPEHTLRSSW